MAVEQVLLDRMRQQGDEEADELVAGIFAEKSEHSLYSYFGLTREQTLSNTALPRVREFLLGSLPAPQWYDEERIKNGQRFFKKYALDIMTLLGALSLPYCYAATPGNKAIYLTEKMRKSPGKRLLDTAHFIIEVMKEGSFDEGGSGFFEIQKTRLIHSVVRHAITHRANWNYTWGVPVNQEDMAGTNLAFSYIIIKGLEQSKFTLSTSEKEDFLYTWRFIGYHLRIAESLLPANQAEAAVLEQAIKARHFRHSEEGKMLTRDLINHYKESFPALAGYFVDSQIRYFIGDDVSEMIGIRAQPFKDKVVAGMNKVREGINKVFINPFGYQMMIRNHLKLKDKYSS